MMKTIGATRKLLTGGQWFAVVLSITLLTMLAGGVPPGVAQDEEQPPAADQQAEQAEPEGDRRQVGAAGIQSPIDVDLSLDSAQVQAFDIDDGQREFVRYEFDEDVLSIEGPEAAGFSLVGPDTDRTVTAEIATIDHDDPSEIIVGFPPGTNLHGYAIAAVESGTVHNRSNAGNIGGSVELDGSRVGAGGPTAAPDLQSARVNSTLNRITFDFDELLDEDTANADGIGFHTDSGLTVTGGEIISIHDDEVVIEFSRDDGENVDQVERVFVEHGAVEGIDGDENVAGALGDDTARPELESVTERRSGTQWQFDFDEPIKRPQADQFVLYTVDGTAHRGQHALMHDTDTVDVSFTEGSDIADQVAVAVALAGAVSSLDTDAEQNTLGHEETGTTDIDQGETVGPDIEDIRINEDAGELEIEFDEPIDEDADVDPSRILAVTEGGDVVEATQVIVVDQDEQIVRLELPSSALEVAEAIVIQPGAVTDLQGNGNVLQSEDA